MHSGGVYTPLPQKKLKFGDPEWTGSFTIREKEPQATPLKFNSISAGVACANRYSMLAGGNDVPW